MADPVDPGIVSIRSIISNADYLSNWMTAVITAGGFSALIAFKDKLTGAALMASFLASAMLATAGWPLLLQYGYGSLSLSIAWGALCGIAGMTMLLTLIGIIRRVYVRRDDITDSILSRGGIPKTKYSDKPVRGEDNERP